MKLDSATKKLYQERETRYANTVYIKPVDRVPTYLPLSYFPARYCNIKFSDAYYNFPKWREACLKTAVALSPDRIGYHASMSGRVMETMDTKTSVWPGHGVDENRPHQFVEGEYMKMEEYDKLLTDQSDFTLRLAARTQGLLAPLNKLPPLNALMNRVPYGTLADPEFATMLKTLCKISKEAVAWEKGIQGLFKDINNSGLPAKNSGIMAGAPFDMVSDFLRGMRGAMLDMYRCPDKLMQACQMFSEQTLSRIKASPKVTEFSPNFIALHRGADGFMSIKQFEKFYWPFLKAHIEALAERGYVPDIFFEGDYTQRLEFLQELPKGKVIARFDRTDMVKAGKLLGGRICISGGMPSSLLQTGTKTEVEKYAGKLIDACAKDGGYIMSPGSSLDEVKFSNLKALVDFTAKYGKYK
jgi:uroporphyrinogen-III decarboxylase